MLSQDSEFYPDSQLQRSIINDSNMLLKGIINSKSLDYISLYANLAHLAHIIKPLNDYDKYSAIEDPSSADWWITVR